MTFRLTFDLSTFDHEKAVISGSWAVDNIGHILLNGSSDQIGTGALSLPMPVQSNFRFLHPFTLNSGFVAGVNTLDFVVQNTEVNGPSGPAGLNVTFVGEAPRPTTYAVLVGSNAPPVVFGSNDPGLRGHLDTGDIEAKLKGDPNWATVVNRQDFEYLFHTARGVESFINTAIADVASKAKAGDTLLFYYSGHGGKAAFATFPGVDEELNVVEGGAYTDDMLTAALRDSRLDYVRKIVILDSCHSGGFAIGDLDQDLESLPNVAVLAAALENDVAFYFESNGKGVFTSMILPLLNANTSFDDLRRRAAVSYTNTITGFFKDEGFGTADVQLFAYASPDFDTSRALNGLPLPKPGDFNVDGTVDAADYVLWRNDIGTQEAYDIWRANFGRTTDTHPCAASIRNLEKCAHFRSRQSRRDPPPDAETVADRFKTPGFWRRTQMLAAQGCHGHRKRFVARPL